MNNTIILQQHELPPGVQVTDVRFAAAVSTLQRLIHVHSIISPIISLVLFIRKVINKLFGFIKESQFVKYFFNRGAPKTGPPAD